MKVKKLHKDAKLRRATDGSAGIDIAYAGDEILSLYPGDLIKIPTGIAVQIPQFTALLLLPRSGLSTKHKVAPINSPGLIDSDYRGEIFAPLFHYGEHGKHNPCTIRPGDFIAQLVLMPILTPVIEYVDQLEETERGVGGFGSTGK